MSASFRHFSLRGRSAMADALSLQSFCTKSLFDQTGVTQIDFTHTNTFKDHFESLLQTLRHRNAPDPSLFASSVDFSTLVSHLYSLYFVHHWVFMSSCGSLRLWKGQNILNVLKLLWNLCGLSRPSVVHLFCVFLPLYDALIKEKRPQEWSFKGHLFFHRKASGGGSGALWFTGEKFWNYL